MRSRNSSTMEGPSHVANGPVLYESDIPSPLELNCFICNANYWTSFNQENVATASSTTSIITFCNFFAWEAEDKEQLLRLATLTDPFCSMCSQKISQLQDWWMQLEALQKAIENLKTEIGELMVQSFPASPNIQGTYNVKEKIVRACESSTRITVTNDRISYSQPRISSFEILQPSLEENSQTEPNELSIDIVNDGENFSPEVDEIVEYEEEVEIWDDGSTSPIPVSSVDAKTLDIKVPKRPREASTRQAPDMKIEAHPDGRCRICPSTFKSQIQLSKHIRRKHSGIRHKCRYCEREFCDTSNRKRHEISVHINMTRDFICDTCGKSYRTAWMLRSHVKVKHEGHILKKDRKLPSQCHDCGKIYPTMNSLRHHVREVHIKAKELRPIYPCTICGRPMKNNFRRKQHEKSHMSLAEMHQFLGKTFHYKCQVCPLEGQMGFRSKAAIREHYETEHPAEFEKIIQDRLETKPRKPRKRYYCSDCPDIAGFTRQSTLDRHIAAGHGKIQLGKGHLECRVCGKPFKSKKRAKDHKDTHHPHPQIHTCDLCSMTAKTTKEMTNHYFAEHPEHPIPTLCQTKDVDSSCDDSDNILSDQESNEETEFELEYPFLKVDRKRFSSRGRYIKPTKKCASKRHYHLPQALTREVRICLERVDQNWPKGKVKRVKMKADHLEEGHENETYSNQYPIFQDFQEVISKSEPFSYENGTGANEDINSDESSPIFAFTYANLAKQFSF